MPLTDVELKRIYVREDTLPLIEEKLVPMVRKNEDRVSIQRYDAIHAAVTFYLEKHGAA